MQPTSNITQPLRDLYNPIRDDLTIAERIFDEELAGELPFIRDLCDTIRSYRGKMLRPAMLLLSARATGEPTGVHRTLAAVIEMVHMATLIHDDVLDEGSERRRQPTVNSIAGNAAAVLLGDYLISHAFHLCSGLRDRHASRRIGATTRLPATRSIGEAGGWFRRAQSRLVSVFTARACITARRTMLTTAS